MRASGPAAEIRLPAARNSVCQGRAPRLSARYQAKAQRGQELSARRQTRAPSPSRAAGRVANCGSAVSASAYNARSVTLASPQTETPPMPASSRCSVRSCRTSRPPGRAHGSAQRDLRAAGRLTAREAGSRGSRTRSAVPRRRRRTAAAGWAERSRPCLRGAGTSRNPITHIGLACIAVRAAMTGCPAPAARPQG